jgi:hypothetical protein
MISLASRYLDVPKLITILGFVKEVFTGLSYFKMLLNEGTNFTDRLVRFRQNGN